MKGFTEERKKASHSDMITEEDAVVSYCLFSCITLLEHIDMQLLYEKCY